MLVLGVLLSQPLSLLGIHVRPSIQLGMEGVRSLFNSVARFCLFSLIRPTYHGLIRSRRVAFFLDRTTVAPVPASGSGGAWGVAEQGFQTFFCFRIRRDTCTIDASVSGSISL